MVDIFLLFFRFFDSLASVISANLHNLSGMNLSAAAFVYSRDENRLNDQLLEKIGELIHENHESREITFGMADIANVIPFVNDYVSSKTPVIAGKRFSTQRHKYSKWQRTRRNKSAKI